MASFDGNIDQVVINDNVINNDDVINVNDINVDVINVNDAVGETEKANGDDEYELLLRQSASIAFADEEYFWNEIVVESASTLHAQVGEEEKEDEEDRGGSTGAGSTGAGSTEGCHGDASAWSMVDLYLTVSYA